MGLGFEYVAGFYCIHESGEVVLEPSGTQVQGEEEEEVPVKCEPYTAHEEILNRKSNYVSSIDTFDPTICNTQNLEDISCTSDDDCPDDITCGYTFTAHDSLDIPFDWNLPPGECIIQIILEDDAGDGWGASTIGMVQGDQQWLFTVGPNEFSLHV